MKLWELGNVPCFLESMESRVRKYTSFLKKKRNWCLCIFICLNDAVNKNLLANVDLCIHFIFSLYIDRVNTSRWCHLSFSCRWRGLRRVWFCFSFMLLPSLDWILAAIWSHLRLILNLLASWLIARSPELSMLAAASFHRGYWTLSNIWICSTEVSIMCNRWYGADINWNLI